MAPAAVRFHPAAAQEAESAYDWYAARNPAVAHGFLEELRHAVAAVAENPRAWLPLDTAIAMTTTKNPMTDSAPAMGALCVSRRR